MPFEPGAMVAMLKSFYPVVTIANLRRAQQERSEYFGGGALFGSCGEKLRLPTGQVWDLMFDCGGLNAHWQAIEPGEGGGGGDDPFSLEPGPLDVLELPEIVPPVPDGAFTQLVADAIRELGASDDILHQAGTVLVEANAPSGLGDALSAALDDAMRAQRDQQHEVESFRPEDVARAADDAHAVTDTRPGMPSDSELNPTAEVEPGDPGPPPRDDKQNPEA